MNKKLFLYLSIVVLISPGHGKVFSRCLLTKELILEGLQKTFISNWVCLIENASQRNTSKVTKLSDGSYDYGLFQINSKSWCKIGKNKGGRCNIACDDLLNDDISDDVECAYKIFNEEGFKNWKIWMDRCKGSQLPDVEKCPEFGTTFKRNKFIAPLPAYRPYQINRVIPATG